MTMTKANTKLTNEAETPNVEQEVEITEAPDEDKNGENDEEDKDAT